MGGEGDLSDRVAHIVIWSIPSAIEKVFMMTERTIDGERLVNHRE